LQRRYISLQRSTILNNINKTRGGTGHNLTAGHCHPATPAGVLLLAHDLRPQRATIGRKQMTQLETSAGAPKMRATEGALLQGWISRTDLAQELGVCEETLRRWADARRGPAFVRAGRKILYRRTAVLEWLETQEVRDPRRSRSGGQQ
jgi:excisionase family DNA binding protein